MLVGDRALGVLTVQSYTTPQRVQRTPPGPVDFHRQPGRYRHSKCALVRGNAGFAGRSESIVRSRASDRSVARFARYGDGHRRSFAVPGIHWAALLTFERDDAGQIQAVQVQGNYHADSEIAPMPIGTRFSKEMFAASGLVLSDTPTFFDDTQNDQQIDPAQAVVLRQRNMHSLAVLPLGAANPDRRLDAGRPGAAPLAERESSLYHAGRANGRRHRKPPSAPRN